MSVGHSVREIILSLNTGSELNASQQFRNMNATLVTADNFNSKWGQRSELYIEEVKAKTEKQKQERFVFCLIVVITIWILMKMTPGFIVLSAKSNSTKDVTIRMWSQWPRGLGHELSSPAQTLRSWVWIPVKSWMSVFILCLCCPVCR
jgi:hypothetical protein